MGGGHFLQLLLSTKIVLFNFSKPLKIGHGPTTAREL